MAPNWARSVGWRAAGACLALGSISAGVNPAGAVDWQVLYRLTETLRVSDNIRSSAEPEGVGFSSNTVGGLDVTAFTPTSEWRTSGDIGYLLFFGEGAPEERERRTVSARSDLLKRTIRTDFNLNAHFRMAPATASIFTDPVLVEPLPVDPLDPVLIDIGLELVEFDRISFGASGGFVHRLTRADNLSLTATGDRVDFTEDAPNANPHTSLELSALWTRRLTRRVDGRAHASARYFASEGDSDIRRLIYNVELGSNFRASRRLTLDGNAGLSIIDQRQAGVATTGGESDVTVGFVGDFSLIYTPWRDTTVTFAVSRQVSPDLLGNLRTAQSISGAATFQINERSSLNLSGALTSSTATGDGGGTREAWIISPTYTHALTRSWNLALTYQWVKSDVAQSNSAFLTLSHNGTILP